ncbi:hypothetical protein [Halopseudomonas aestusnigri]|uniref:hypothetical protein n=1 Tax=Halopseudomonas aestusnigri TaxID=857252 RepID=UPI0028C10F0B|nr:hypothetical protein YSKK_06760 [Halopseudomonas aestusnigri]
MDEVKKDSDAAAKTGGGRSSEIFGWLLLVCFGFALLWNWDGFWQTQIKWLTDLQVATFPVKHAEENLKVNRVTQNNRLIDGYQERMAHLEAELESSKSELALIRYSKAENCRYLDAAVRMFDNTTADLSSEARAREVRCTSRECDAILNNRAEVKALCL